MHRRGAQGLQTSYRKGSSLEFREYRPYEPGDDFRFIDWNVWERLGRLLVKVFTAEEDRTLHLLIDSSGSMGTGSPTKLRFAAETAAALAYISGRRQDRTGIFSLGENIKEYRRPVKGSNALQEIFQFLTNLTPQGPTNFKTACTQFLSGVDRSGIAVVLSDLLDAGDYREGIKRLLYRRFEVVLIHVMAEEDQFTGEEGPVRLRDRETGKTMDLTLDGPVSRAYRERYNRFVTEVEMFCQKNGVEYIRVLNTVPVELFLLDYLRRGGILR
jgi:uncharacterized protein (DUF58 family)